MDLSRKDISNQINDIWEWQKKMAEFWQLAEHGHVRKKIVVAKHGMKEVEAGTILLGIDKNNVIADKVLSYFECLSSSLKYILLISGLL